MKVCYTLSYNQPNYVRTSYILQTLAKLPNVQVFKAINSSKGMRRYAQTLYKLIVIRLTEHPDVYILGFRGTEIYWPVRLITLGRPLIYDEFLNPYLWAIEEHDKLKPKWLFAPLVRWYGKLVLLTAGAVLSDTDLHAEYSSKRFGVNRGKFTTLYVGTDEEVFDRSAVTGEVDKKMFKVFFYGNFLPLHGIHVITAAAEILRDKPIVFTVVGGANRKKAMKRFVDEVKAKKLTNVIHFEWVDFHKLPKMMADAHLCLAGPFGGTPQGQKVITGKAYQLLSIARPIVIGKIDEEVGFVDKKNCLIVDQNSPESLANALNWAYDNKEKLEAIGLAGERLYKDKFSQSAQLYKLADLLEQVSGINPR